jgi:hypothetical protein
MNRVAVSSDNLAWTLLGTQNPNLCNLAQLRRLAATFSPLRVEVIPCTSCFGRDVDRIAFALELALLLARSGRERLC